MATDEVEALRVRVSILEEAPPHQPAQGPTLDFDALVASFPSLLRVSNLLRSLEGPVPPPVCALVDQAASGLTGPVQGSCPDYPQLFLVYFTVAALQGALDLAVLAAIEGAIEPRPLPLQALSLAVAPPATKPATSWASSSDQQPAPVPGAPASSPALPPSLPGMSLLELANDTTHWTDAQTVQAARHIHQSLFLRTRRLDNTMPRTTVEAQWTWWTSQPESFHQAHAAFMDEAVSGAPRPSAALGGSSEEEDVVQAASANRATGQLAKDTARRVASAKSSARPGDPAGYTRCIVGWKWKGEGRQPAQPNEVAVAKALRQALGPSSVAFVTVDMFDFNKGYAFVGLTEDALVGTLRLPVGSKGRSSVAIPVGGPGASAWSLNVSRAFLRAWDPKVTPKKAGGDPSTILKPLGAQPEPSRALQRVACPARSRQARARSRSPAYRQRFARRSRSRSPTPERRRRREPSRDRDRSRSPPRRRRRSSRDRSPLRLAAPRSEHPAYQQYDAAWQQYAAANPSFSPNPLGQGWGAVTPPSGNWNPQMTHQSYVNQGGYQPAYSAQTPASDQTPQPPPPQPLPRQGDK